MAFGKEVLIGLILTILSVILSAYYLFSYNSNLSKLNSVNTSSQVTTVVNQSTSLSSTEIAKHNTPNDCWIIINSKVLKISPYLQFHPGGESAITNYCGQDATSVFKAIKSGNGHSSSAVLLMEKFLIGLIGENVTQDSINKPVDTSSLIINNDRDSDDADSED